MDNSNENDKDKENYIYLLNIIDYFSKFAQSYLQISKNAKETLTNIDKFVSNISKPHTIQCDNGGEFKSKLLQKYCKDNIIELILGALGILNPKGQLKYLIDILKIYYII